MIKKWITEEMAELKIGDKRLNDRMMKILSQVANQPEHSLPQIFKGHAEIQAAYRFFPTILLMKRT